MPTQLPTLNLADGDLAALAVDAVVIGVYSLAPARGDPARRGSTGSAGQILVAAGAESIVAAFDGRLVETLVLLGATGAPGEVVKLATLGTVTPALVVAVGLGTQPASAARKGTAKPASALPEPETLRRAAGAAVRALAG
ncbi:MAG: hypothetical protein J2P15_22905, partial [Micromonosporaceae bacterium]|nr:hypothetical protein [Micromonosporaceae bacterium]